MIKTTRLIVCSIIFLSIFIFSSSLVFAAQVTRVQGKKVMMDLDDDSIQVGSKVYATNSAGKRIALIEVQKIKGKKALGQILKGKAIVGSIIIATGSNKNASSDNEDDSGSSSKSSGEYWGVLAGIAMNSMKVSFSNPSDSATMSGSSFNLLGFYEYPFFPQIAIRFWAGMETFAAKGKSSDESCEDSTSCDISVSYLGFGGVLKYEFFQKPVRYWAGAHYEYLVPMSKSSTAIADSQISNNYAYGISTGLDYPLGGGSFIPVHLEYSFFSNSDSVKATQTIIRAGYGMVW